MPLGRHFDGFVEQTKLVLPTSLVNFERNRYGVPAILCQPTGEPADSIRGFGGFLNVWNNMWRLHQVGGRL